MSSPDPGGRDQVLITRPEPGARDTATRIAALGLTPVLAPVLAVHAFPVAVDRPDRIAAVLVTSGNAIPSLPATLHGCPLLAVGDATARRATGAGFTRVTSAAGDADALADLVRMRLSPAAGPVLLASGRGQGLALAAALRAAGFRVVRRVAYAAWPVAALPETAHAALTAGRLRTVLVFSAETARHFMRLTRAAGLLGALRELDAITIAPGVSVALQPERWSRVRAAAAPDQDAMLALLR